jgi:hypothetical protein
MDPKQCVQNDTLVKLDVRQKYKKEDIWNDFFSKKDHGGI